MSLQCIGLANAGRTQGERKENARRTQGERLCGPLALSLLSGLQVGGALRVRTVYRMATAGRMLGEGTATTRRQPSERTAKAKLEHSTRRAKARRILSGDSTRRYALKGRPSFWRGGEDRHAGTYARVESTTLDFTTLWCYNSLTVRRMHGKR